MFDILQVYMYLLCSAWQPVWGLEYACVSVANLLLYSQIHIFYIAYRLLTLWFFNIAHLRSVYMMDFCHISHYHGMDIYKHNVYIYNC